MKPNSGVLSPTRRATIELLATPIPISAATESDASRRGPTVDLTGTKEDKADRGGDKEVREEQESDDGNDREVRDRVLLEVHGPNREEGDGRRARGQSAGGRLDRRWRSP